MNKAIALSNSNNNNNYNNNYNNTNINQNYNYNYNLVDDNIITGRLLSRLLQQKFKHEVTCVLSGQEALKQLSISTFDLIFMDIDMPELSGIDTSIKIRESNIALEKNRKIPILAYTTNKWDDKFSKAGM
ncbi:9445_t:CDS:2 [Diversispora eburnea]|uniref:9445_t:CDS:1 n=1 Tax=Diversispora eburnea TaxID=1213867 RepID=A0A9N9B7W4_9GLOM|nr:9445_t:CDS:2 [Diversispora eburnea]